VAVDVYQPDVTEMPSQHTTSDNTPIAPEFNKLVVSVTRVRDALAKATAQTKDAFATAVATIGSVEGLQDVLNRTVKSTDLVPVAIYSKSESDGKYLQIVAFGTTASTARPSGVPNGGVYWIGTGTTVPTNALPADLVFLP